MCVPPVLHPGAELTMRMRVPHGTQLAVFTPKGRSVVLIPFSAKAFRDVETLTLAVDTLRHVFADSGVYALTLSSEAELSASEMCRVRYGDSPKG